MKILDLGDNSSISRFASIGLTSNLLKYGKKLAKLDVSTVTKPKIYNYKADKVMNLSSGNIQNQTNLNVVKVPFPVLINEYKILASNYTNSQNDYKSMGTLNIILTPFDNVMKFKFGKQDSANAPIVPYNLSDIMLNSNLSLIFKSDTKSIEKNVYSQSGDNNLEMGVVVFKVNQEDIPILKQMIKDKFDNFYIILTANKTKSLLYSGKFKIYENIKFVDLQQSIMSISPASTTSGTTTTNSENQPPPQFDANGIPILNPNSRGQLDYYRNLVIWARQNLTTAQISELKLDIGKVGSIYYFKNGIYIVERVKVEDMDILKRNRLIELVFPLKLDFGWTTKSNTYNVQIIANSSSNPANTSSTTNNSTV